MTRDRVAELIRRHRVERGLTQAALAKKVGVSVRTVQKWETGAQRPKNSNLLRLARILGLDPADLV